jgi:hypothetical protein
MTMIKSEVPYIFIGITFITGSNNFCVVSID